MSLSNEQKKQWAFSLFMQGETLNSILSTTEIGSDNTLRKWIKVGKWEELRAAKHLSREELVNGLLNSAMAIIRTAQENGEYANIADSLIKITASIEKIEPNSVVDSIGVFSSFTKWLQHRKKADTTINDHFMKKVNSLQNTYIKEKL